MNATSLTRQQKALLLGRFVCHQVVGDILLNCHFDLTLFMEVNKGLLPYFYLSTTMIYYSAVGTFNSLVAMYQFITIVKLIWYFYFVFSVCIKVLDRFVNSIDEDVKKNQDKVEQELKNFCKNLKNKEERFVSTYMSCIHER